MNSPGGFLVGRGGGWPLLPSCSPPRPASSWMNPPLVSPSHQNTCCSTTTATYCMSCCAGYTCWCQLHMNLSYQAGSMTWPQASTMTFESALFSFKTLTGFWNCCLHQTSVTVHPHSASQDLLHHSLSVYGILLGTVLMCRPRQQQYCPSGMSVCLCVCPSVRPSVCHHEVFALCLSMNVQYHCHAWTGLDSSNAARVVDILAGLASAGVTVIITIHQPRPDVFNLMQRVLILSGDGRLVYSGTVLCPLYEWT